MRKTNENHGSQTSKDRPYTCDRCGQAYATITTLTSHNPEHDGLCPSCCARVQTRPPAVSARVAAETAENLAAEVLRNSALLERCYRQEKQIERLRAAIARTVSQCDDYLDLEADFRLPLEQILAATEPGSVTAGT